MKTNKIARHGDILFVKSNKIVGEKKDTKTVALGEVTGHHHSFGQQDNVVCYADDTEVKSVDVIEEATITHQEHKPITLEKGSYRVFRKFEYDPFGEVLRKVRD